ncbi:SDR family oxidoreductase [Paenarthrobacter sp. A20]|uniref:SDR family oxidoreductase n=1 Tax=Paenarthrobacter sp. A20 TaxID=2817891 RepID=UPI0020A0C8FE|nr:SDR family oxidoreductase [Paenarthrobacter sp. A20]MCP1415573.1 NADP-dependent 3-hydroxy acid dehydrogenase YdfG [Paenarthrobacter sp. A20]
MGTQGTLWVVGGGSGMGRAAAVVAAQKGWNVAVTGRRADAVSETASLIRTAGGDALEVPADARDEASLSEAHKRIVGHWGPVTAVVLAAGLNAPARTWGDQNIGEFAAIIDTNLTSVARVIDLVLPGMRAQGQGNIVVVSSRAAWRFSPGSGVAYMTSKTGLSALVASLNDQEGANGIKACHLCPGDVDTDFLSMRPEVPDAGQRSKMLSAEDIARSVQFILDSPQHVRIDELALSPIGQR